MLGRTATSWRLGRDWTDWGTQIEEKHNQQQQQQLQQSGGGGGGGNC